MNRPPLRRVPTKVWAAATVIVVAALAVVAVVVLWPEGEPTRRVLPGTKQFVELPPGSQLPSGEECAAKVRRAPEVVDANTPYNQTTWHAAWTEKWPARADGRFTGTTDEIIQWAACKWGMDEDVLRAQAYQESNWRMTAYGDVNPAGPGDDGQTICAPGDGGKVRPDNTCAESIGIMQVRTQYYRPAAEGAVRSTAYNLDVSMSVWRECYEGEMTYLRNIAPNAYRPGDMWGCIGRWFAGNWYSEPANQYIARVREHHERRVWEIADFDEP